MSVAEPNALSTTYAMVLTSSLYRIDVDKKKIKKGEYMEPCFSLRDIATVKKKTYARHFMKLFGTSLLHVLVGLWKVLSLQTCLQNCLQTSFISSILYS